MYVYLIETEAVLFSAFPALSYLTSVSSAILIRSTTLVHVWRRLGIHGLWTRVHAGVQSEKRRSGVSIACKRYNILAWYVSLDLREQPSNWRVG